MLTRCGFRYDSNQQTVGVVTDVERLQPGFARARKAWVEGQFEDSYARCLGGSSLLLVTRMITCSMVDGSSTEDSTDCRCRRELNQASTATNFEREMVGGPRELSLLLQLLSAVIVAAAAGVEG